MGENKNVVTVMFQNSVVVKGIEKKLAELGYNVSSIVNDFERVKIVAPGTALFVLYLPSDVLDDKAKIASLNHIVEYVKEAGKNMLVIGEVKYHTDIQRLVPDIKMFDWVNRPIDMDKFRSIVENAMENKTEDRKKRILIVDDDPSYAKMVREWIKDVYKVDVVTAGMQAISFLLKVPEDDKVDLILLDYEMPVVDGPQVLQMLRQDPATMHIPVIFLTGIGTKEAVSRVMALKPDGYILKSTTRADILGYIGSKF